MALFGGPSTPVSRLEELKRLLQKDPTSRQFLALAEEYRRHGKYRDAVITLERGLQLHSTSVAAHVALGRTYQQLDRLEDAIRAFTNALRLDRENLVAIRQLAEVYLAKGDKIEAIKKLKLYRGLKAGDRDVNEIIQKLEEEMSVAVAERPRSGVQPALPDFSEAPRPLSHSVSAIRRAAMIPRLERVEAPPSPPPPPETKPDLMELTYDGAAISKAVEAVRRAQPEAPPCRRRLRRRRRSRTFSWRPVPSPLPPTSPALSPFTAPIASIREQPAPEKAPFTIAESEQEPDVPEEQATAPFTFPVGSLPDGGGDVLCRLARRDGSVRRLRRAPRSAGERTSPSSRKRSEISTALRATWPMLARRIARSRRRLPTRRAPARCARRPRRFPRPSGRTIHACGGSRGAFRSARSDRGRPARASPEPRRGDGGNPRRDAHRSRGASGRDGRTSSREAAMETLVAEVSSFLKNLRRTTAETGTGELESLAVAGPNGGVVVSPVNADYSLILRVDPEAALGEIRWEAARTARALRPAVR